MTEEERQAALLEIAQAMAALELEYTDEHLEFYCPACKAFVSADWGSGRRPHGMSGYDWAVKRMKHEEGCPVIKARTLIESLTPAH